MPSADVNLDPGRRRRTGIAEAVFAPGKTASQCCDAVGGLLASDVVPVVLTRASPTQAQAALAAHPGATALDTGSETTPMSTVCWRSSPPSGRTVALLTAGTADLPVAREVAAVLAAYGIGCELVADVGVAGLHRVLARQSLLEEADAVVVVAGMEGALASVVAGLTCAPVIAVPTSTGYGSGLDGITALLGMLASCSPGITVVGVDNGFGAACACVRLFARGARS
jgi:NCAIR mutase (PurE)-related protein